MPNYILPNWSAQTDSSDYKNSLDAAAAKHDLIAGQFYAHEADVQDMTVVIDGGRLMYAGALVIQPQQITTVITAPVTNPRIDRIVITESTGAYSIVTGTEAVTPVAPDIPGGSLPCVQFQLETTTTVITNNLLIDERVGSGSSGGLIPVLSPEGYRGEFLLSSGPTVNWARHTSATLAAAGARQALLEVHNAVSLAGATAARSREIYIEQNDAHAGLGTSSVLSGQQYASRVEVQAGNTSPVRDTATVTVQVSAAGEFDYFIFAGSSPGHSVSVRLMGYWL